MALADMTTIAKNWLLDYFTNQATPQSPTALYLGALFSGSSSPATTALAEVGTPGSNGYARQPITWNVGGLASPGKVTNNGVITLTMPNNLTTGSPIAYVAIFSAVTGGNLLWYCPATLAKFETTVSLASPGVFETKEAHGFSADDRVILDDIGTTLPTGLTLWTAPLAPYYIGTSTGSTVFTLSTTAANANPVNVSAAGGCIVRKLNVQAFSASQQLQVPDASLTISLSS